MDKELSPWEQLERLIHSDCKHEFISLLRSQWESLNRSAGIFPLSKLLKLVCNHRAVGCATALLEGEAGLTVDVNVEWEDGLSPLHLAAQNLSSGLTELLLQHGAKAGLCNYDNEKDLAKLPLGMALKAIRDHEFLSDWGPEKSVYKLIYIFCLQDLKEPLKTINLLALNTEDLEKISLYFVELGEAKQFAALLMVAWDRLVAPFIEKGVEGSPIGEHLWRQLGMVTKEELELMISCFPSCECLLAIQNKKKNLVAQWKLLKILEKGRGVIEEYRHSSRVKNIANYCVPYDVSCRLYRAKLNPDVVYTDDIKCLLPKLKKKHKDRLNRLLEEKMRSASILRPAAVVTAGAACTPPQAPLWTSPSRLFHDDRILNDTSCERPASQLAGGIQVVAPSLSKLLPPATTCARFILTAKKFIK